MFFIKPKSSNSSNYKVLHSEFYGNKIKFILDVNSPSQELIYRSHSYKHNYSEDIITSLEILKEGDVFIDIGAHVGYFSIIASKIVKDSGLVIAFEPDEKNKKALLKNIHINNCNNITICNRVISDTCSQNQKFFINDDNDGGHSLWDPSLHPFNVISKSKHNFKNVNTMCLDSCKKINNIHDRQIVLKIDTEGAEVNILSGANNLLSYDLLKMIICEVNKFGLEKMNHSSDELFLLLYRYGFYPYLFLQNNELFELDQNNIPENIENIFFFKKT